MTSPATRSRVSPRLGPHRFIAPLALISFAVGCSGGDVVAPMAPAAPALAVASVARVATVDVTSLLDDGNGTCTAAKCTLRDAISFAPDGANITFADKLCPKRATPATGCIITLSSAGLTIGRPLQVLGPARYTLAVDGGGVVAPVLAVSAGAVVAVSNFTISGSPLSAVVNEGTLTLNTVEVSGNGSANGSGGGIFNRRGGSVTLASSKVTGNLGIFGGGIYNDNGSVTLTGSTVAANRAGSGGGIYNLGGTLSLTRSSISGNTAVGSGGGIFNWSNGVVTLTNSSVSSNSAAFDAGGIWTEGGSVTLTGSTVSGNDGASGSGGIFANGAVTLQKRSCVNNNSQAGVASAVPWSPVNIYIFTFGSVTGTNCRVAMP